MNAPPANIGALDALRRKLERHALDYRRWTADDLRCLLAMCGDDHATTTLPTKRSLHDSALGYGDADDWLDRLGDVELMHAAAQRALARRDRQAEETTKARAREIELGHASVRDFIRDAPVPAAAFGILLSRAVAAGDVASATALNDAYASIQHRMCDEPDLGQWTFDTIVGNLGAAPAAAAALGDEMKTALGDGIAELLSDAADLA